MRNSNQTRVLLALVLAVPQLLFAQDKPLNNDPGVKTGKLKNGFRYYIRHNEEPKGRATIYLANQVGSVLETDQEQGIAHFIEHMNFNGTKHFPKNELIGYLERSGVKFGADLNAFTTFDETVYQLPLPTDDASLWKKGMLIMRDWAADATLSQKDFDQERGVIREEKRLRNTAGGRMGDQYRLLLFNNSRYASRMPIGKDEVINQADVTVARNFYKRWYRPDLQALIIVGDINVNTVEQQLIQLFSDLKTPVKPAERTQYPIALRNAASFQQVTDPEFGQHYIQYYFKALSHPLKTEQDFKLQLTRQLTNALYAARLRTVFNNSKLPYLAASGQINAVVGNLDALTLSVSLNPEQIKAGFTAFWQEMERIRNFGFTAEELKSVKERMGRGMELALSEKDKQKSVAYADDYLRNFTGGDAYLSIEERDKLVKQYLGVLSLQDVSQYLSVFLNSADRSVIVLGPDQSKKDLPDQSLLNSWEKEAALHKLPAFQSEILGQTLLTAQPLPGKIVKEEQIKALNMIHWQLSNGMQVYLKPSSFKNDEVLFTGFSQGGTSRYEMADFYAAKNASAFVTNSGLGKFNANQLNSFLNTKALQVKPYIADRTEGIAGASAVKDLPVTLEMIHGYMTEARLDTARFKTILEQSKAAFRNRTANPQRDFTDTITTTLSGNHPRRKPMTLADIDQLDSAKMHQIFTERFSDASDFTFVFTGNLQTDSLKPLVERYLASLPARGSKESARDLKIRVPEGQLRKDLTAGSGDKASVQLVLSGKYNFTTRDNLYLDLLKTALGFRLTERLREKEGGVYTPAVYLTQAKEPLNFYSLTVSFDCDPAKMEQLIKATQEEIDALSKNGVTADDLKKFTAEQSRADQLNSRTNEFWLSYVQTQLQNNEPLNAIATRESDLNSLSAKASISYSKQLLNRKNEIIVTLRPQSK
jgi:zinc protease